MRILSEKEFQSLKITQYSKKSKGLRLMTIVAFIKKVRKIFTGHTDPAKNCGFHKSFGCSHVDGPLCDFPCCSMFKEWYKKKQK